MELRTAKPADLDQVAALDDSVDLEDWHRRLVVQQLADAPGTPADGEIALFFAREL